MRFLVGTLNQQPRWMTTGFGLWFTSIIMPITPSNIAPAIVKEDSRVSETRLIAINWRNHFI